MTRATDDLTIDDRRQLMSRICTAMQSAEPELGEATQREGVWLDRLEPQLNDMMRIAWRTSADRIEPFLSQVIEDICGKCPVQQASGFCPLRHEGGCVLFRNPRLVIDAIDCFLAERAAPEKRAAAFTPSLPRKERTVLSRILVAVDESAPAVVAVAMGVELATKLNAELALVHVTLPPQPILVADMAICDSEPPAARLHAAHALVKKIRKTLPPAMSIEELVADGFPADKICAAARDWNADLIILGTHGRRGVTRFILGSTAEAVMRRAGCPVLIARAKAANAPVEHAKLEAPQTVAAV